MRSLVLISLILSGCGSSFIEPGEYNVSSYFIQDDFLAQAGQESTTIWDIAEHSGTYTVTIMGGAKGAVGTVEDGRLTIYKEDEVECGGKTSYSATIALLEGITNQFSGTANMTVDLCFLDESQTLYIEAHLIGERR